LITAVRSAEPHPANRQPIAVHFGESIMPAQDAQGAAPPQPVGQRLLGSTVTPRLSDAQINTRVSELAEAINQAFAGSEKLVVIGVMKGALVFTADLIKHLNMPCQLELVSLSSYGNGDTSSGRVNGSLDHLPDLSGQDVLIVEDILDTGRTLNHLTRALKVRFPGMNRLKTAVLLDKPSRREQPFEADFTGFTVENEFLVGRGLDFQGLYRNLPYVGVLHDAKH